jgi:hypothetical protein
MTAGDLYKARLITDGEFQSAVDAYFVDPAMASYVFANGYHIDVVKAVSANEWARGQLRSARVSPLLKRIAVRTAIMLAQPAKG